MIAGMIETSAPAGTAVGSTRRAKLSAVNEAIRASNRESYSRNRLK
jgi:hypothetical protein